jgi:hypothetical protein
VGSYYGAEAFDGPPEISVLRSDIREFETPKLAGESLIGRKMRSKVQEGNQSLARTKFFCRP